MTVSQKTAAAQTIKHADFTTALALELYREGKLAEAREVLRPHVNVLSGVDLYEAVLLLSKIENADKRYRAALHLLESYRPMFAESDNLSLRARFHLNVAGVRQLEGDSDGALIEYEAGIFHYEQAGMTYDAGCALNNIAILLAQAGRFQGAHDYADRARKHFKGMDVKLAEVNDSEAQIFLAEGKPLDAYSLSLEAQRVFLVAGEMRLFNDGSRTLQKAIADYAVVSSRATELIAEKG